MMSVLRQKPIILPEIVDITDNYNSVDIKQSPKVDDL